MRLLPVVLLFSLNFCAFAGQSSADVVEPADETPAKPDKSEKPAKVVPKPESEPIQRTPLFIDEPDFKARLVNPATPAGGLDREGAEKLGAKPKKTKKEFSLPTEEGVTETDTDGENSEDKEEISAALARVIEKDHGKKAKDLVPLYEEVAANEPENAAANYRLGLAYFRAGDLTKALPALEKAVVLNNKEAKYLCDYGLAALRVGWLEKGAAACRAAAAMRPSIPRYQSALGDAALTVGDLNLARDCYTRACNLAPDNANYMHSLGLVYLHAGEWKRAIEVLDEAIRLKSDAAAFYCSRGLAYQNARDVKQAIVDYNLAIRADKKNAYAHYLLAGVYSDIDDPTYTNNFEAMDHAQLAVKLSGGKNAQYLMGLARAMRVARNYDGMLEVARKAAQLDPRYRAELGKMEEYKSKGFNK